MQAAGATIAVFFVMLVLYRTRIIKVTEQLPGRRHRRHARHHGVLRRVRSSSACSPAPTRSASCRARACSASASACSSPGSRRSTSLLDFDFIERGAKQGLDKNFEWYAAFGLLVTIVWLYLEMLRLLSKLRER